MNILDRQARRDSTNELYDRACDLLVAAEGIRAAAAEPGSAAGIAATLGCIESALGALEHATAAMRREADRQLAREGLDVHTEFSALVDALEDAHRATDALRRRSGPLLARLTLSSR
jgi:hypothetical protein